MLLCNFYLPKNHLELKWWELVLVIYSSVKFNENARLQVAYPCCKFALCNRTRLPEIKNKSEKESGDLNVPCGTK